jgi:hypothetical protein
MKEQSMSEQTHELLDKMTVSPALAEALSADTTGVEVAAGQVWRVRWDDESTLALVLEVTGSGALVISATMAVTPPNESEVPVQTFVGDTLSCVTVWPRTKTELPLRVFERPIETGSSAQQAAVDALTPSLVVPDPFDLGLELEAELRDELEQFAAAPALLTVSEPTVGLVSALTGDFKGSLSALKDVLGLDQFSAQALLRGHQQLTADQVEALAAAGFERARARGAEVFKPEYVAELEKPEYKAAILLAAHSLEQPEQVVRQRAAKEAFAYAARLAGSSDPVAARVRAVLAKLR